MADPLSCQNVKRPLSDILLNTILPIILLVSYVPQILRICSKGSTFGLSLYYVTFGFLFTTCQLSNFLYFQCYRFPVLQCIDKGSFSKLESYGAVLGLVQIAAVWTGSAIVLALLATYPSDNATLDSGSQNLTSIVPETIVPGISRSATTKTLFTICVSFVLVLLLPAIIISLPRPTEDFDWAESIYMGASGFFAIPASLILVITLFIPQVRLTWAVRDILDTSCLSVTTLVIQMVAFMLLSISWFIRLGKTGTDVWTYLHNMLFGGGQAVLFFLWLYCKFGRSRRSEKSLESGSSSIDEQSPLLMSV